MAQDTQTKDRVNIAISRSLHERLAHMAQLFGKPLQNVTDEAIQHWIDRNAARAKKKSAELLPA